MNDQFDPESATIDQMDRFTTTADRLLDSLEARLRDARQRYERTVSADNRPEIREVYERVERPTLDAAEADVEAEAEAIRENLHAVRDRTAKPVPTLPPEQMADAANRLVFVEKRCKDWPLAHLLDDLRQALVTDDRPALLCFLQALPTRLADETPDTGQHRSDPAARERAELRRMLGVAKERLTDPRFSVLNQRALDTAVRASAVGRDASKRRQQVERKRTRYAFQRPDDVPLHQSQD